MANNKTTGAAAGGTTGAGYGSNAEQWFQNQYGLSVDQMNQLLKQYPGTTVTQPYSEYGGAQQTTVNNDPLNRILQTAQANKALSQFQQPPPQPPPPQQPQQPQLAPAQPMPTVNITPLTAQPQAQQQAAQTLPVPQASAAQATPLFSLGQGSSYQPQGGYQPQLPQAQNPLIQPPTQQFQSGGEVLQTAGQAMQTPATTQYGYQAYAPNQSSQSTPIQNQYQLSDPNQGTGIYNPAYGASLLGAAALNIGNAGPGAMVINPQPGGTPSDKSGVSPVGGASIYSVPSGYTPGGIYGSQPGIFAKAPMPALGPAAGWNVGATAGGGGGTPTMPLTPAAQANAAQMPQQPITPAWGANAGAAMGAPLMQQPGRDSVHAMLTPGEFVMTPEATAAMGAQNLARVNASASGQPPSAPGPAAGGAATALGTQPRPSGPSPAFMEGFQHGFAGAPPRGPTPPPPAKMQTGGYVYPQDQQQQVLRMADGGMVPAPGPPQAPTMDLHTSALANAGMAMYAHYGGDPQRASLEDIANFHNQLLSRLGGGQTTARGTTPIKMQTGGIVPDDPDQIHRHQASETAHRPVTTDSSSAQPSSASPPQGSSDQASSSGTTQDPAGQGYNQTIQQMLQAKVAAQRGAAAGGGYNTPYGYVGGSPQTGQSGYIYPSQSAATAAGDVGSGPGGGAAGPTVGATAMAAGGISSLASGLAQAAQTYADSVKPFIVHPVPMGNQVAPPPAPTNLQQTMVA